LALIRQEWLIFLSGCFSVAPLYLFLSGLSIIQTTVNPNTCFTYFLAGINCISVASSLDRVEMEFGFALGFLPFSASSVFELRHWM
jgi:hypothetical protein